MGWLVVRRFADGRAAALWHRRRQAALADYAEAERDATVVRAWLAKVEREKM